MRKVTSRDVGAPAEGGDVMKARICSVWSGPTSRVGQPSAFLPTPTPETSAALERLRLQHIGMRLGGVD